jgi:hypothetical protein
MRKVLLIMLMVSIFGVVQPVSARVGSCGGCTSVTQPQPSILDNLLRVVQSWF